MPAITGRQDRDHPEAEAEYSNGTGHRQRHGSDEPH